MRSLRRTTEIVPAPDGRSLLWYDGHGNTPLHLSVAVEAAPADTPLSRSKRTVVEAWRAASNGWTGTAGPWRVTMTATTADEGVRIAISLQPLSADVSLALRRVDLGVHGFASRSVVPEPVGLRIAYCGAYSRSNASRSAALPLTGDACESSWWVGALSGPEGPSMVLGAEEVRTFATQVLLQRDGLVARQHLEGWVAAAGDSLALDALWLGSARSTPHALLERFAERLGRAHGVRPVASPCGWGSWGHWLEQIDMGLMRETLLAIEGMASLKRCVRVVQIDDGWSELLESGRVSASWRPNRRFPSGIAPLAAEIRRAGRECGLWLLPFTVNGGSSIVTSHPEWLVANAMGTPMQVGGGESYCLDPTHPGAADWLRDVFTRLRDWGVRYVKLDFLRALLVPDPDLAADDFDVPRRYAGARTRVQAYRAGLALIRDVLGDDAILVACSAPAAAGAGLIDTHRVGPDVDPHWTGQVSGVRDAARALIANWFWQGRAWINDPDYLLACESESVTRFWTTVVAMSGGAVVLSADFATLGDWAEKCFAFATPPLGRSARPLDLFANGPDPRLLQLALERDGQQWYLLAVLNWTDSAAEEQIALKELGITGPVHVWDAWRQTHRIVDAGMRVLLAARDAALFRLTPLAAQPQLVGTDVHWAQGWFEFGSTLFDTATGVLRLEASPDGPRGGQAWIWVPQTWTVRDGAASHEGDLVRVRVFPGQTTEVRFRRSVTNRRGQ